MAWGQYDEYNYSLKGVTDVAKNWPIAYLKYKRPD